MAYHLRFIVRTELAAFLLLMLPHPLTETLFTAQECLLSETRLRSENFRLRTRGSRQLVSAIHDIFPFIRFLTTFSVFISSSSA